MRDLTASDVRKFWAYMSKHYNTKVLKKDDDLITIIEAAKNKNIMGLVSGLAQLNEGDEIGLIAMFLDRIDMLDVEKFMTNYTTTLTDRIYVPFEIGSDERPLLEQVIICAHEHQHVLQWKKDKIAFIIRYLADRAQRALYEAEAWRCSMEVEYFLTGDIPRATGYAKNLADYGCTKDDIEVVNKALRLSKQTIEAGGITTSVGKIAIKWLSSNL